MSKSFRYYENKPLIKKEKMGSLLFNFNAACNIDIDDIQFNEVEYENSKSINDQSRLRKTSIPLDEIEESISDYFPTKPIGYTPGY